MAQRTIRGSDASAGAMAPSLPTLSQPEEQQTVPAGAGGGARHGTERRIPAALVLVAIGQDLDLHGPIPVDPVQESPRGRNAARGPDRSSALRTGCGFLPARRH